MKIDKERSVKNEVILSDGPFNLVSFFESGKPYLQLLIDGELEICKQAIMFEDERGLVHQFRLGSGLMVIEETTKEEAEAYLNQITNPNMKKVYYKTK